MLPRSDTLNAQAPLAKIDIRSKYRQVYSLSLTGGLACFKQDVVYASGQGSPAK
jgi:hypothetical protein